MNDIRINERKIGKFLGERTVKNKDRAYTHEEIKKLLDVADSRLKIVVLLMASAGMRMDMSEIEVGKKISFVAKYGPMGDKVILIVPKEYHGQIQKMKNPLKITAEEILE